MKSLSVIFVLFSAVLLGSCATGVSQKNFPPESFVVSGKMNPMSGSKTLKGQECWLLEAGSSDLRQLKYYQITGAKELTDRLHEEDMKVTIRVIDRPDVSPGCNVGTVVEVLDIVEARSKSN